MKLLHIDSSILGEISASRQVTAAIVARLREIASPFDVIYRDLAEADLPHITPSRLPGDHPLSALASPAAAELDSAQSQAALDEFLASDIVVIGAPMYNFTIPSQLKAWIDRIVIPGKTFSVSAEGVTSLVSNKHLFIAISRGGFYGAETPGASAEHTETYLRTIFAFIGLTPHFIVVEGAQAKPELRQEILDGALKAAGELHIAA